MDIAIIIMTTATFLFVGFSYIKFGVTTSISAVTYLLDKSIVWLFWLWLSIVAVGMVYIMPNAYGVGAFCGYAVTGVTIWHNRSNPMQSVIHTVATTIAILATFLSLWFNHGLWEFALAMLAGGGALYFFGGKNRIYYVELTAIILTFSALVSI